MAKKINDFRFKQFEIRQQHSAMKVGTDGVLLGAWADIRSSKQILDIGTGTGLIALMAAQRTQSSKIDAIEIDGASYHEALTNVENSPWKKRITLFHDSLQEYSQRVDRKYSNILSNPPFFNSGSISPEKSRSVARHDFNLTNDDLLKCCQKLLTEDGIVSLILPTKEGEEFIQRATGYKFFLKRKTLFQAKVDKKPERLLLEFSFKKEEIIYDHLIHYTYEGRWSKDYIQLTKDFYLNV